MQGYSERERWMKQFRDDPGMSRRLVAKCAAALVIVVGLLLVGFGSTSFDGLASGSAGAAMAQAFTAPRGLN